jgi:hypothetical protein
LDRSSGGIENAKRDYPKNSFQVGSDIAISHEDYSLDPVFAICAMPTSRRTN